MPRRLAFLSMDSLDDFLVYDALAIPHLNALGWSVDEVSWRADVDWSQYEVVVIRSPWDYQDEPEAFLETLERIANATRLENGLDVVRWNLDKTYLRDLADRGVPIVPTGWLDRLSPHAMSELFDAFGVEEIVVKPTVSANADGTFRLHRDDTGRQLANADLWFEAVNELAAPKRTNSAVMVQPFVPSVVDEGEYSVFAFNGEISHTILKVPASGDFRVQEEHGGKVLAVEPEPSLLEATDLALAAVTEIAGPLLYARADLVRWDGGWAVMEMELIEPSLYFAHGEGSAEHFARALDALMTPS
ncbi:MAG: ATP-grasp domain protein [Rubricoccaceae bacterium]